MPTRLAEFLVSHRLVSRERVNEALRAQAIAGGALDTVLLEQGALPEPGLLQALGAVSGLSPINLAEFEPNLEVAPLLPAKIAERLLVVPLSLDGRTVHVACAYPPPGAELTEVAKLLGKEIVPWITLEARVRDWMAVLYGTKLPARIATVLAAMDPNRPLPAPAAPSLSFATPAPTATPAPHARAPSPAPPPEAPAARGPTPAPPAASPAAPGSPGASADALVEDSTLEESLVRAMVDGVAERVAQEPIPLVQVKARPARATPSPAAESPRRPLPGTPAPFSTAAEPPPEWTLEQVRAALAAVQHDREGVKDVALRYARRTFDFVAAFAVIRGTAIGWDARGEGSDAQLVGQVSIPLDSPSVFRTAALTRSSYVGPLPSDGLTKGLLSALGRAPRTVFVFPVEVKSRIVALIYGDSGSKPVSQRRLSELLLFCQDLPAAFAELILARKQRLQKERPREQAPPAGPMGWTPSSQSKALGGLGRAAGMARVLVADAELPPPDFAPLLKRLTGPDAAQRARAMAELARVPESSARALAAHFPGPSAWSRLPVVELPDADELGPICAAMVRLGRPGAQALAPLLDSRSSDVRYFALLAAGNVPFPELLPGVLRGLFDLEPDISSAARVAAAAFKQVPRFADALRGLRQELTARDPVRRALAAKALGELKDRDAVEGLIGLTGSDDGLCAQAAAEALAAITRATFGTQPRAWSAWWAENRTRRRSQWVVAALRHRDLVQRMSALEELSSALGDALGYRPEAPEREREVAVRAWEEAVLRDARLEALDA